MNDPAFVIQLHTCMKCFKTMISSTTAVVKHPQYYVYELNNFQLSPWLLAHSVATTLTHVGTINESQYRQA